MTASVWPTPLSQLPVHRVPAISKPRQWYVLILAPNYVTGAGWHRQTNGDHFLPGGRPEQSSDAD